MGKKTPIINVVIHENPVEFKCFRQSWDIGGAVFLGTVKAKSNIQALNKAMDKFEGLCRVEEVKL